MKHRNIECDKQITITVSQTNSKGNHPTHIAGTSQNILDFGIGENKVARGANGASGSLIDEIDSIYFTAPRRQGHESS